MSDIHGLIPHQTGYYYITLEEDYVAMFLEDAKRWREQAEDTPVNAKKYAARKAHAVAKAYISSVLEQLSDKQFKQGIPEHKIWVYVSFPEIEARCHGGVKIRVLKDAMKEMDEDGWVSKRPNPDRRWRTKVYQMNFREYRKQLNALPKRVGLIDSADMHDTTPEQEHSADMHDSSAKMHDGDANLHEVSADMHPRITNRDNTDVTQNNKDTFATSRSEDRTPAPVTDLNRWKTDSEKRRAMFADIPLSKDEEEDISKLETIKHSVTDPSQQTPGAGTRSFAADPPVGSQDDSASVQASLIDPAQRTASREVTEAQLVSASARNNGAVQASGNPPMALTAKQIQKQLERRVEEVFAIYAEKIGRRPSRSKANKDGALLLAQDDVSDEDIKTTIDEILKDNFMAKNLNLTYVHSKIDALARKPIPIQHNGKASARDNTIGVSGLPRLRPPHREVSA